MIVRTLLIILFIFIIVVILIPLILSAVGIDILPGGGGGVGRSENYLMLRSGDDGKNWDRPIFAKEPRGPRPKEILDVAFHPNNPGVLFAGTRSAGLWKSEDDGVNWRPVIDRSGGLETRADVYKIAISRSRPEVMYLAAYQGGRGRVLKSEDGGTNFRQIYFVGRQQVGIFDLYTPPARPDELMVAGGEGRLLESRDGGERWRVAAVFGEPISLLRVNPSFTNELYVITSRGRLFKTFDSGANWIDLAKEGRIIGRTGTREIRHPYERLSLFSFGSADRSGAARSMAVDPRNTSVLYRTSSDGLLTSLDGGFVWQELSTVSLEAPPSGVAVHPTRAETLLATSGQTLYTSSDRGVNWKITPLFSRRPLREIFIHPQRPEEIFITTGR